MFENQVNWNETVTLVEGVFDNPTAVKEMQFLYWVNSFLKN